MSAPHPCVSDWWALCDMYIYTLLAAIGLLTELDMAAHIGQAM